MGNRLTGRNKSKSLTPNQENASRKASSDALSPSADLKGNVTLSTMNSINPESQLPEVIKMTSTSEETQTATTISDTIPQGLSDRIMEEVTAAGIKMASEVINSEFGKIHDTIERASSVDASHKTPSTPLVTPPTPQPSLETSQLTEQQPAKDTPVVEEPAPQSQEEVKTEEPKVEEAPKVEEPAPVVEVPVVEAPAVQESGLVCESVPEPVQEPVQEVPVSINEAPVVESLPAAVSEPAVDAPVQESVAVDETPAVEVPVPSPEAGTVIQDDECQIPAAQVVPSSESVPSEVESVPSEGSKATAVEDVKEVGTSGAEIEVEKTISTSDAILDSNDGTLKKDGSDDAAIPIDTTTASSEAPIEKVTNSIDVESSPVHEPVAKVVSQNGVEVPKENGIATPEPSSDNNNSAGIIEDIKSSPAVEELKCSAAIDQISNSLTSPGDLVSNDNCTTVSNGVASE